MILLATIPVVIVEITVLRSYESRVISSRNVVVKNQCDILCNQLARWNYLENPNNETITGEFNMLTTIYGGRILIINKDYRIIKDTYNLSRGKYMVSPDVINCFNGQEVSIVDDENQYVEMTVKITDPDSDNKEVIGVLLVSYSTKEIMNNSDFMARRSLIIATVIGIFILIGGYILSGVLVRPFRRITQNINSLSENYLEEPIHVNDYQETQQISDAFNVLIKQVKVMNDSRSEFVANVSHELKTPLTSMKVLADSLLMNENTSAEEYREFMTDISAEIDRENKIISDLLLLVRMDKKADELNIEETNVNELLDLTIKRLKPIAERDGVELIHESFRTVTAQVDPAKMMLIFTNLIENGIKYNIRGGWVRASLNSDPDYMFLTVSDSGIGIPEEYQDHIFERFYRVDKSHSKEIGGTGLGLAITKSAVQAHGGAIKVQSSEAGGCTFLVRIPLVHVE